MGKAIQVKQGNENIYPISAEFGSGYVKFADGTLIQYGTDHVTREAVPINVTINFPINFIDTNYSFAVSAIGQSIDNTNYGGVTAHANRDNINKNSRIITLDNRLSRFTAGFEWIAIGRWK